MTVSNKKPGRPKGAQNKLSGTARENIQAVFVRLGGTAAMAEWAEANRADFYRAIYPKLVTGQFEVDANLVTKIIHETVIK